MKAMLAVIQKVQNPDMGLEDIDEEVCIRPSLYPTTRKKNLENKSHKCLKERFGSTLKFFLRISKKYESLAGFKVDQNHFSRCV